jgi:S-adenosylhomocysteine hydrolase
MTEIIINQALIAKQVITEKELVQSIQEVKKNQFKLPRELDKIVS